MSEPEYIKKRMSRKESKEMAAIHNSVDWDNVPSRDEMTNMEEGIADLYKDAQNNVPEDGICFKHLIMGCSMCPGTIETPVDSSGLEELFERSGLSLEDETTQQLISTVRNFYTSVITQKETEIDNILDNFWLSFQPKNKWVARNYDYTKAHAALIIRDQKLKQALLDTVIAALPEAQKELGTKTFNAGRIVGQNAVIQDIRNTLKGDMK